MTSYVFAYTPWYEIIKATNLPVITLRKGEKNPQQIRQAIQVCHNQEGATTRRVLQILLSSPPLIQSHNFTSGAVCIP